MQVCERCTVILRHDDSVLLLILSNDYIVLLLTDLKYSKYTVTLAQSGQTILDRNCPPKMVLTSLSSRRLSALKCREGRGRGRGDMRRSEKRRGERRGGERRG